MIKPDLLDQIPALAFVLGTFFAAALLMYGVSIP